MRTGLTVSAIAHAGMIALAILGLGLGRPIEATPVESIAVDLVPISEFSNIRLGSLESEIVETETPSAVDAEKPAELAQPTGNTTEDQPTPEDTPDPTPAPTVETAPAPEAAEPAVEPDPAPEPEVTPVPEVKPEPEPAPAEEPAPVEPEPALVTPVETPDPAAAAPQPRVKTASLDEKRAEFKKRAEAEKKQKAEDKKKAEAEKKKADDKKKADAQKRVEQAKADEAAKVADEVASIINNEDSRGATSGDGGEKTLGKQDGRSATLSQSEIDGLVSQIRGCLNVPAGAAESGLTAQLEFSIDASGMVTQLPRVVSSPANALEQALASAAQRAVMRCGPYQVAGQEVRATFDPREF